MGYKNTINYSKKLKLDIFKRLNDFGKKAQDLRETIDYILIRNK